jgi:selenium metabolism protein YedF
VTVDNEAARENVTRFLGSQQYDISVEKEDGNFHVIGTRENCDVVDLPITSQDVSEKKKIMVMISTNRLGRGDDTLGTKLMENFITTLKEMGDELWRIIFVNNGVKLTIEDSEVLSVLKELEGNGTHILVCGTCLDHFNLLSRKQVGETTNMLDIVTAMQLADKVINL